MNISNTPKGKTQVASLVFLVFFSLLLSAGCAAEPKSSMSKSSPLTQSYVWYDGDREQQVWLNPDVVAEFDPSPQGESLMKSSSSAARIMPMKRQQAGIRLWQSGNSADNLVRSLKSAHPKGKYSVMLHDDPTSEGRMRALPGNIIVYLDPQWDETSVSNWLKQRKLEVVKKLAIGPNIYVIKTGSGMEALEAANVLYQSGEVKAAFPDWWQSVSTR